MLAGQIQAHPNPAVDIVYIQSPVPVDVILMDVAGKVVREIRNAHRVSVKDLAAGVYLLYITDQNEVLIKVVKTIKQDQ